MTAIGMLVYCDLTHDSRVQREAASLAAAGHRVVVACLPAAGKVGWEPPPGVKVVPVAPPVGWAAPGSMVRAGGASAVVRRLAWTAAYLVNVLAWGWRARRAVARGVDVWHVHDLTGLLGLWSRGLPERYVYDVHELHVEQPGGWSHLPRPARSLVEALERRGIRRASAVITVNRAVAVELRRRYAARDVVVVHNCATRRRRTEPSNLIRAAAGIPSGSPVILYQGLFSAPRGLGELLLALLEPGMETVHAAFLGYGDLREELLASSLDPAFSGRVHVLSAVPPGEVVEWVASADVAVMPIQPDSLNGRLSTPNKLFEAIVAGVPVVTSDFPAMASIVRSARIGAVCDPTDPRAIARAIRSVLERAPSERDELRGRCHAAARRWNWETEARTLLDVYAALAAR